MSDHPHERSEGAEGGADRMAPPAAPDPHEPANIARRFGAPHAATVPRTETVRVTAPDLERRAAMERTRGRLKAASFGFSLLFFAILVKVTLATVILPQAPSRPEPSMARLFEPTQARLASVGQRAPRAMITDRNGQRLAVSLPTVAVYANPKEMIDAAETVRRLKMVLPGLDAAQIQARLVAADKQFVYLARQVSPEEQREINALGIPGIYFEHTARRRYPLGNTASQVLGGVDVDGHGVAGVEMRFEDRLTKDPTPLRLSIDVRVQAIVHDELTKAMVDFRAIGGTGIVMDVRTGEIIAMVSLPDYNANLVGLATQEQRFNRAVTGMYEPGSTYKLQTASMALDAGVAQIWHEFDASHPLSIGRYTISDFEGGKKRWLYLPEVLAYSSNIGAARVALTVGAERQRTWLRNMGMFERTGVELPEAGRPLVQSAAAWKEVVTMTVAFGHGISVSPLHVVRGTAAIANGGILVRPTLLAQEPGVFPSDATRIMQQSTSDLMRRLMRLIVTDGFGSLAEVPGYYPGGKTGTAEKKVAGARGYSKSGVNVTAFTSVFPMNAPRYAVYMMLDEPKANASTQGYRTAGRVVAPAAGKVIARVGPMLGLMPEIANAAQINAQLAIPLQPARPANGARTPPVYVAPKPAPPPGHHWGRRSRANRAARWWPASLESRRPAVPPPPPRHALAVNRPVPCRPPPSRPAHRWRPRCVICAMRPQ